MYIDIVPNRNSPPAILLREAYRENGIGAKRTMGNISSLPMDQVEMIREVLRGKQLLPVDQIFEVQESLPHGHVEAVLAMIKKLGLDQIIASKPCRERDLVVAMIVEQILYSSSKLADTRLWHTCTLAEELNVSDADENELYAAMDWLVKRQGRIECKLAKRHLSDGDTVFYDISSSYYEGRTCELAQFGHNRDKKKGTKIIVYGMLTDDQGRPLCTQVYPGNTADCTTVPDQIDTLRNRFGLNRVVVVGDRGMLKQPQIDQLHKCPEMGWISALTNGDVRKLALGGSLQLSLFDQQNLAEIQSPDFPGERLVACFNPLLAEERDRKRETFLRLTEGKFKKIQAEIKRRTKKPLGAGEIGVKVGKTINRWKMGKHFVTEVADQKFTWRRNEETIKTESMLDGIYIIRTSEPAERFSAREVVRQYKNLANVEMVFRTMKGVDVLVRPIRHRLPDRVRAHIFLCTLAYYVIWHMKHALSPILFADESLSKVRAQRDPVAKAVPSENASKKRASKENEHGESLHSFPTLLEALKTRCRNRCVTRVNGECIETVLVTRPNALHKRVFDLLGLRLS